MTGPVVLDKEPQRRPVVQQQQQKQNGTTNTISFSKRESPRLLSKQSSSVLSAGLHVKPTDARGAEDNHKTSTTIPAGTNGGHLNGKAPDVGSVVSKAKRAAQSLWLIIHAQNCRLAGDRCPHAGCNEAKKVLLHLKTCNALPGRECPVGYNGCYQSRKLLEHHQKCKELRAKQAGMGRRGREPHVCLVCSLVARQARSILDGGRPMFAKRTRNNRKQVIASFTLHQNGEKSVLSGGMGPPPPRTAPLAIATDTQSSSSSASSSDEECKRVESPPSRNHLMLFSEVAAAAAPPAMTSEMSEPQVLGKSLDSSRSTFLTFAANALHSLKQAPPGQQHQQQQQQQQTRRARAESYDERAHTMRGRKAPPSHIAESDIIGNDPTLEFQLRRPRAGSESLLEQQELESHHQAVIRRERSASLGVLANLCVDARKGAVCDTIAEESREHEGVFEMDDTENA